MKRLLDSSRGFGPGKPNQKQVGGKTKKVGKKKKKRKTDSSMEYKAEFFWEG